MKNFDIAVIGNWHLSSVTAGVLASKGHRVLWVNHEGQSSGAWKKFPELPVIEPGLKDLFTQAIAADNLDYANSFESWSAKYLWIAIDTPVDDRDEVDLAPLRLCLEKIKSSQSKARAVLISSQVPLGFCEEAEAFLKIPVVYVPENLRLGKGIETFERADRTVLGATKLSTAETAKDEIFGRFTTKFLLTNLATSEMIKHATNAFLATSISFANQMALIGDAYGVDNFTVGRALKMDLRIGPSAYVMPGLGFAGGTLPRDLRVLSNLAERKGLDSGLVRAVLDINQNTTQVLVREAQEHLKKNPGPVLILGYTYKADTDTLRRSLSIDVAEELKKSGHELWGFDPLMNQKDYSAISPLLTHFNEFQFPRAPSLLILMTSRPQFREVNFSLLKAPSSTLLMDAQGFFKAEDILKAGLSYKLLWGALQRA